MPRHIVLPAPAAGPRHPVDDRGAPAAGDRAPYARSLILGALLLSAAGLVLSPDKTASTIETADLPASPAEAWAALHELFETTRGAPCEA